MAANICVKWSKNLQGNHTTNAVYKLRQNYFGKLDVFLKCGINALNNQQEHISQAIYLNLQTYLSSGILLCIAILILIWWYCCARARPSIQRLMKSWCVFRQVQSCHAIPLCAVACLSPQPKGASFVTSFTVSPLFSY